MPALLLAGTGFVCRWQGGAGRGAQQSYQLMLGVHAQGPLGYPCAAHPRQIDELFTIDRDLDEVIEDVAGATGSARTSGEHRP